ncbi:MAG: LptF/LptG family permease, partial [Armatimonadota bacterium]|nr:LptF/LptG family permease [Armatimonadota bacterium]
LDRYVLKEMVAPFMVSIFAFLVLLIGRVIYDNLDFIVGKRVPLHLVLRLVFFQLPWVIGIVLPLATLFATSLSVNRLGRDSEITAIRMTGTPLRRIFSPIFLVGLVSSLIAFWFGETVTPWANRESQRIVRMIWGLQNAPLIQDNVFFNSENYYFYVQKVERPSSTQIILRNVMVYETPVVGGYPMLMTASWATNRDNLWTLYDGVLRKIGPDGFTEYETKFRSLHLNLKRPLSEFWESQYTPEEMSFRDLRKQVALFAQTGRQANELQVNLHFKLSIPFSCLIFALCAAPLGVKFSRSGSYSGILLGIVIMFFYQNNIWLGKALGIGGIVPPILAGWSQNIIFGLLGLYLIWREE